MKIIIVGAGKMGMAIARELSNQGHDITMVDRDPEHLETASNMLDVITVEGNGADFAVLREAGVRDMDLLIAASGQDETNLVSCAAARALGVKNSVARVKDPSYNRDTEALRRGFGISATFNPDMEAAREIARILQFPTAARVETFARGRAEMVEYRIPQGSALDGLALKDLPGKLHSRVLVCAVEREGAVSIPNGEFVLHDGDRLNIAGARGELRRFFTAVKAYRESVRSVVLLGGSRIAAYLSRQLTAAGIHVTILERDHSRCEALCDMLPDVTVICGDGSKQEVLLEEGIRTTDAFVALTGFDEDNIIISMYARRCGVGKVVTKVSDNHFVDMLQGTGLDTFICPKLLAASELTRYVRAMKNAEQSSVETLYRLMDNQVEALEFRVGESGRCVGRCLRDLDLRGNVLLAAIIRNGEFLIPGGNTQLLPGDHAVVVTTRSDLQDLDSILA